MAKTHQEAVLAASCVQTPVHPHTRTPLTLYERLEEDKLRLPRGDDVSSCSDDEGDQPFMMKSSKDWVLDISRTDHSDKEYYMKVERLKDAHMQSMEQLERMYKHKLNLKGVHRGDPVVKSTFRPAWEQRPYQPDGLDSSLLKPDFNWNVSSGVSEASFEEQSDGEDSCDTQDSTSATEKILQMWNGFSVQDYIKDTTFDKQKLKHKTDKGKPKEWSHRVTIPEPFEMTIRESKKKELNANAKSKSEIELENNLLKKRLEEEAECQKMFRANPVPASVYLPLYHEIMERNEERRRFVKERSKEILLASQKPFQFNEREDRKKQFSKIQLVDHEYSVNHFKHFKARPVPKSIYGTSVNERFKEEELYRGIRIHMRSQELLHSSSYPTPTLACRHSPKSCKARCYELTEEPERRPKINTQIPNFQVVHQNNQKRLKKKKNAKHVTICAPFQLHTDNIPSHREKIIKDIEADEESLKETRWPFKSPRRQPQKNSLVVSPREEAQVVSPRSTESSKRREQAIRRSEKQRMEEYLEELDAMKDRVSQTPLLLERVRKENARLCVKKHYSSVLKDARLPDGFVLTKGQTFQTSGSYKGPNSTKEDIVNSDDEEGSQGMLEIEDLQGDGDDQEDSANESEEDKQEYSTDEDHTDSDP
ncbi:PREDICTED: protein FAM161A [Nanorana parkeri]|uniref:protein FAM161A n=1 Tax=Nanorana parkeri TaxID=125878 RepID=UPI000853FA01|nr:PREDICTED: protein FAM161A [Nanorana parkeri]